METTLLGILILIVWISLYKYISKVTANTETLRKEIQYLRKLLESRPEDKREEESAPTEKDYIPISVLTVEMRPDKTEDIQQVTKPAKKKKPVNYEKYIGENLFGKIGILILVIGMGLFVKYAIDKDWINELFRTIMGFVVGAGLLLIAERLKKTYRTFSSLLAGGAFAIFYVTVAMAYHYYGLFSQAAAFITLAALTICMSALSIFYNRRELAIIALIGGFISPFLVSNGMGSYLVLFAYLTVLNIGMFGLALYKKWGELPAISFIATYVILLGYSTAADLDVAGNSQLIHILLFSTLFYLIFLLTAISIIQTNSKKINQILMFVVVLNNFLFLFFCIWFLNDMRLAVNYKGAFTLFIALVNAIQAYLVYRKKTDAGFLYPLLTGLALTFVSITIPIQLDGTFITLLWASEMVIVLWLYSKWRLRVYEYFSLTLLFLTLVSFLVDTEQMVVNNSGYALFANGTFATGVFTGLSLLSFAWVMHQKKEIFQTGSILRYTPFNAIALLTGSGVLYAAFMLEFGLNIDNWYLSEGLMLVFTSAALCLLLILLRKRFPMERHYIAYSFLLACSACWYIALSVGVTTTTGTVLLPLLWFALAILVIHICLFAKYFYRAFSFKLKTANRMTGYISILSTLLLIVLINNMLHQLSLAGETNAGFSVSLSIAAFIQMTLGMRLHLKSLRIISLISFGVVLLKLIVVDLWLLPTIGKIFVFIILGIILLILSFLYQKLKQVLFEDTIFSESVSHE